MGCVRMPRRLRRTRPNCGLVVDKYLEPWSQYVINALGVGSFPRNDPYYVGARLTHYGSAVLVVRDIRRRLRGSANTCESGLAPKIKMKQTRSQVARV